MTSLVVVQSDGKIVIARSQRILISGSGTIKIDIKTCDAKTLGGDSQLVRLITGEFQSTGKANHQSVLMFTE